MISKDSIGKHSFFSFEIIFRIYSALALVTATFSMSANVIGILSFIGSVILCLSPFLNPGYVYRINTSNGNFALPARNAISEVLTSAIACFLMSLILLINLIDGYIFIIVSCTFALISMYSLIAVRDILIAISSPSIQKIKRKGIFLQSTILGFFAICMIYIFEQPLFVSVGSSFVLLPLVIALFDLSGKNRNSNRFHSNLKIFSYSSNSMRIASVGFFSAILMVCDNFVVYGLSSFQDLAYYSIAFAMVTFVVNVVGTSIQRNEFRTNSGTYPALNWQIHFFSLFFGVFISIFVLVFSLIFENKIIEKSSIFSLILCLGIPFRIRNLQLTTIIEKFGTLKVRVFSNVLSILVLSSCGFIAVSLLGIIGMTIASVLSSLVTVFLNKFLAQKITQSFDMDK